MKTKTECSTKEGIAVALIDGIIAQCRVLRKINVKSPAVVEALKDLRSNSDANSLFANSLRLQVVASAKAHKKLARLCMKKRVATTQRNPVQWQTASRMHEAVAKELTEMLA